MYYKYVLSHIVSLPLGLHHKYDFLILLCYCRIKLFAIPTSQPLGRIRKLHHSDSNLSWFLSYFHSCVESELKSGD